MAAYAALVSLLNNIHQIMNHPHLSISLENENIQPLLEKTGLLLDFTEGNNYGGGNIETQDLERKIACAAHAAEDLIESHVVDQIHEASNIWPQGEKSLDLQQINEEMDAIMNEANELKEKHRLGEEQQPTYLAKPDLMESGVSAMVGLDAELNQLLDELNGYQSSRHIISIVGMGGTGKTTLAKNIYENLLIKEKFRFRAWAIMSQQNNPQEVLSQLLSSLGELSSGTLDDLGLRLHKALSYRRYLIIIDDIWSVKAWDEVKLYLPDVGNGSRVLLTTRLSNVAKDCGSSLFVMNLLDEENSWKLFREKAFQGEDCPHQLREVGKEIVKLCKGLALSIVVIGGLLQKSPKIIGYWMKVEKDLKSIPDSEKKETILDVLSLSYHHLPPHLKPCFLYIGVFKEDSQIRVSSIIKLWVAEGFIKPIGSQVLEEIAKGLVRELIDRNLLLVGTRCKNGEVGSFGIHDLLRDLCIKIAKQEEFFHVIEGGVLGTERRLIGDWDIESTRARVARTIMRLKDRGNIQLNEYRLLRVLVEGGYTSQVDYHWNVNLRYLAYKIQDDINPRRKLPTSLSLIWNLQTLIIEDRFMTIAPVEFWKMRQLRHVECSWIHIPDPPPSKGLDGLLMLENLQTFKRPHNFRLSEEVCKIIPNIKKLNLFYKPDLLGYDDSLIDNIRNLDCLQKLESLDLVIIIWKWLLSDSELRKNFATSLPRSLKKLSLTCSQLYWDDLKEIGSLPQLEVLKLECSGSRWSSVDGQFCRLKYLELRYCNLTHWDADNSHFPVLEKLILFSLDKLEEIPPSIGDIPTLQLIRVDWCGVEVAVSAVRIKEDQVDNGSLQVQIDLLDQDRIFNQMLEREGLTTDNIQLL